MRETLKIRFFIATIESILLYGCKAWTLTEAMEHSLNGTNTRMLRKALNMHWSSHIPNEVHTAFITHCKIRGKEYLKVVMCQCFSQYFIPWIKTRCVMKHKCPRTKKISQVTIIVKTQGQGVNI
jgi:hypothetical protein